MTLKDLEEDQRAKVIAITGGSGLREKLALRGISEGVGLKAVSTRGPVTVNIGGNIVTIGQGMAKKVKVRKT